MYFHFGRKKIRCHATTIIYTLRHSVFNKRLFNNTICMRTNIQLHYYATISMKVTIFNAGIISLIKHSEFASSSSFKKEKSSVTIYRYFKIGLTVYINSDFVAPWLRRIQRPFVYFVLSFTGHGGFFSWAQSTLRRRNLKMQLYFYG